MLLLILIGGVGGTPPPILPPFPQAARSTVARRTAVLPQPPVEYALRDQTEFRRAIQVTFEQLQAQNAMSQAITETLTAQVLVLLGLVTGLSTAITTNPQGDVVLGTYNSGTGTGPFILRANGTVEIAGTVLKVGGTTITVP